MDRHASDPPTTSVLEISALDAFLSRLHVGASRKGRPKLPHRLLHNQFAAPLGEQRFHLPLFRRGQAGEEALAGGVVAQFAGAAGFAEVRFAEGGAEFGD